MIDLDFRIAVAGYILIYLAVFFVLWLSFRKQKDKELLLDDKFLWYCSVCTYTFINTKEENISTCPRCGSYNKKRLT
jgi:hypothetical protein